MQTTNLFIRTNSVYIIETGLRAFMSLGTARKYLTTTFLRVTSTSIWNKLPSIARKKHLCAVQKAEFKLLLP